MAQTLSKDILRICIGALDSQPTNGFCTRVDNLLSRIWTRIFAHKHLPYREINRGTGPLFSVILIPSLLLSVLSCLLFRTAVVQVQTK